MDKKTLQRFRVLRGTRGDDGAPEGQIELLVRALETAMDKIHHLEFELAMLQTAAGQSADKIQQRYVDSRMDSRFSSAGTVPWSLMKWRTYLESSDEMAQRLVPDDEERKKLIDYLGCLT